MTVAKQQQLEWLARNVNEWGRIYEKAFFAESGEVFFKAYPPHELGDHFTHQEWLSMREKLQNKPSWKDAPEWANWVGQESNGRWDWFGDDERPPVHSDDDCFDHSGYGIYSGNSGEILGDWRDTLEKRPESVVKKCKSCESMTLEEAIKHARDVAKGDSECSIQHAQLADWLEDYREIKMRESHIAITTQDNSWHERGELPPAGTECEILVNGKWDCVYVVGVSRSGNPVCEDSNSVICECIACQFRPLRNEREMAIDEMLLAIDHIKEGNFETFIGALYDAGYRKVSQ